MRAYLLVALAFAFYACGVESGPAGSGGTGGSSGSGPCSHNYGDDGGYGYRYAERWVADRILLPGDPTVTAFDLDGDGHPDDQLGSILRTFKQQGFDPQPGVDAMVQDATILQLVDAEFFSATCPTLAWESLSFTTGTPNSPACTTPGDPTTCGQHLHGDAPFTIASYEATLNATGPYKAITAGPGTAVLHVALLGSTPLALPLVAARASFREGDPTTMKGAVGGAISQDTLHNLVFPAVAAGAGQAIGRDCPGGVCQSGSDGEKLLSLFDTDHDGAITAAEIEDNQLIKTLSAPDIDTDGDTTPDALSAVFGLHLVGAVF